MFGKNLKSLRKLNNMTQYQLAEKLNVSHKTISHWEKGYSEPQLDLLVKIKQVLGCSYEDLLKNKKKPSFDGFLCAVLICSVKKIVLFLILFLLFVF